jgi:carbon storage regulator CsrA
VIARKCNAEICIGPDIIVKVLEIRKGQIKVGIDAPSQLSIWRGELLPNTDRRQPPVEKDASQGIKEPCLAKSHRRHS